MEPDQFSVNEAWLVFRLNDDPIRTEQEGLFNAICLMDAASCFILAVALIPAQSLEPSEWDTACLFKDAWKHRQQFPAKLFVPIGEYEVVIPAQAQRHGILVVMVPESDLSVFTREARESFRERVQRTYG